VDRRGALAACTAGSAAPVLREVRRGQGIRVWPFVEEPAGRDLPGAGDLMARREITEAGRQRLERYERREEWDRLRGFLPARPGAAAESESGRPALSGSGQAQAPRTPHLSLAAGQPRRPR